MQQKQKSKSFINKFFLLMFFYCINNLTRFKQVLLIVINLKWKIVASKGTLYIKCLKLKFLTL